MKISIPILIFLTISGCASSPKVGDKNNPDYPIVISESSSVALRDLSALGLNGFRDLSISEFEANADDIDKHGQIINPQFGNGSYAVATATVGAAAGVALDFVSGAALIGFLGRDDKVRNYEFSRDLPSEYVIATKDGTPLHEYLKNHYQIAADKTISYVEQFVGKKPGKISQGEIINKENGSMIYKLFFTRSGVIDKVYRNGLFFVSVDCNSPKASICKLAIHMKVGSKRSSAEPFYVDALAKAVDENLLIYLPPNKEIYQLPAVIYGGGRVEYLVEKSKKGL